MIISGDWLSTTAVGHWLPSQASSVAKSRSRLACHGISRPRRRTTITFSSVGLSSAALSASSFMAITLPRRRKPSAVISSLAPLASRRVARASAA
ncbi:hypothetical protein D3C85_1010500 [compost metagenome]